jgi:hypothetical protein
MTIESTNFKIKLAIDIFGNSPEDMGEVQIVQAFEAAGIDWNFGVDIFTFLPVAFCRRMVSNVAWEETYLEVYDGRLRIIEKKFSENKNYQLMSEVADVYFNEDPNRKVILRLLRNSSEFNALNEFLNDGCELKNAQVTRLQIVIS